ncbi:glycosyltransferase family 4 protein [Priestia aryabhattai]|uniref:glycosyltransferase family 4 protein n=1 Tax=Priestia aryabhattai TaxID=412384 RepID=UPI000532C5A2|nr:glycosyltransferase family 4 protein [Priestia aryabhattai]
MKRIIILCETMSGGVRRHLVDLISNIDRENYEIHMIYSSNRSDKVFEDSSRELEGKIKFYDIKEMKRKISFKDDIKSLIQIIKIIRQVKPHLIHCHSSKAGLLGRVSGSLCRINVIYTPHAYFAQNDSLAKRKRYFFTLVERFLSKGTKKTINVSYGEQKFALQHKIVKKNKSTVIYNGISDLQSCRSKEDINNRFIVGTLARVDDQKNPFSFIKVGEALIEKYPNMDFVYVGDGELLEEARKYVSNKKIADRIKFIGFSGNIVEELQRFNIYLSTALYEGLPYAVIEALALKKPLVLSDVTGNNELVIPEYNGFLFPVNQEKIAIEKIELLYNNREAYEKYSTNSYKLFEQKFNLESMIEKIQYVYDSL